MKLRRFPHLRRHGAADPLDLLRALPPGDAREAERMLRRDHAAERAYIDAQIVESGLPAGGFERLLDSRLARSTSTGGGRRRPTYAPAE